METFAQILLAGVKILKQVSKVARSEVSSHERVRMGVFKTKDPNMDCTNVEMPTQSGTMNGQSGCAPKLQRSVWVG